MCKCVSLQCPPHILFIRECYLSMRSHAHLGVGKYRHNRTHIADDSWLGLSPKGEHSIKPNFTVIPLQASLFAKKGHIASR